MTNFGGQLPAVADRVAPAADLEMLLLDRAAQGEVEAFDALLRPRLQRLCRMAVAITRSEADARDAVQEASIQAWRQLPKLRDQAKFDPWLSQIVVNACRGLLRSQNRRRVREIAVTTPSTRSARSGPRLQELPTRSPMWRPSSAPSCASTPMLARHRPPLRRAATSDRDRGDPRHTGRHGQMAPLPGETGPRRGAEGGRAMSQREHNDAVFQAALTPAASASLTSGLADAIHDALVTTPQVKASSRGSIGGRGFATLAGSPVAVLFILALLVLIVFIVVLSSRPTPAPLDVSMYRGGPERTGVMPGPGPTGDPTLLWQISAKGPVAVMPAVVAGTFTLPMRAAPSKPWTRRRVSPAGPETCRAPSTARRPSPAVRSSSGRTQARSSRLTL